jgi:hypothetical protein
MLRLRAIMLVFGKFSAPHHFLYMLDLEIDK